MQIDFRKADSGDLDEVCTMVQDAATHMIEQNIFQWDELYPVREDFAEDIAKRQLMVGLVQGRIAVIYVLNQECDAEYDDGDWKYRDEPFYVIHRLCVSPGFQRMGIAASTLLHIEDTLKAVGIRAIRLDVFSGNPFALRLYERAGFFKTGEVHWRKGMFYLMEKRILDSDTLKGIYTN